MNSWTIVDAKAKFSELVQRVKDDGPQIVTRNGKPAVVVVSVEEWERKTRRKGMLYEFFRNSPLVGSGIQIERIRDRPRDIDL